MEDKHKKLLKALAIGGALALGGYGGYSKYKEKTRPGFLRKHWGKMLATGIAGSAAYGTTKIKSAVKNIIDNQMGYHETEIEPINSRLNYIKESFEKTNNLNHYEKLKYYNDQINKYSKIINESENKINKYNVLKALALGGLAAYGGHRILKDRNRKFGKFLDKHGGKIIGGLGAAATAKTLHNMYSVPKMVVNSINKQLNDINDAEKQS